MSFPTSLTPRQWYRIENASPEAAEVYVYDEISPFGVTANDFVRDLSGVSSKAINLHLNTPGGDVFDGIAIYNGLKNHPAIVNVFIEGLAASIGTVIAMAGNRVVIAPHAKMMIHDAWAVTAGDAADMAKMAERLEATSANIAAIYAERAGQDVDHWRALMRAETWYSDTEAVAAGLADEVGRSNDQALRQAAAFDLSTFRHGESIAALLRAEVPEEETEPEPEPEAEPTTTETNDDEAESERAAVEESWLITEARRRADERDELDAYLASVEMVKRS